MATISEIAPDLAPVLTNPSLEPAQGDVPEAALRHYLRGLERFKAGNNTKALSAFEHAPLYSEAWFAKGATLDHLGEYQKALEAVEKALEIRPDYPEALANKGADLWLLDRHQEALGAYEEALTLRPDYPEALGNKGFALWELGRLEEAQQALEQAFKVRDGFQQGTALLFGNWSALIVSQGLVELLDNRIKDFEEAGLKYIDILEKAQQDGMAEVVEDSLTQLKVGLKKKKELKAFEELELFINLMKIKDPFEGWRALGTAMSERWPKGVSAVDAIREQRK